MKNGELPRSNYGPCMCRPQKADTLEGVPDRVQRPARKEVSLGSIGPNKEASGKGYKVVEVRSGGEPMGFGADRPKRKRMQEMDEDYD
jgi:hypothetical protein